MSVVPVDSKTFDDSVPSPDEKKYSDNNKEDANNTDVKINSKSPNISVIFSNINTDKLSAMVKKNDEILYQANITDNNNKNPISIDESGKIKSVSTENLDYKTFSEPRHNGGKKSRRRRRKSKGKSRKARSSRKSK